MVFLLNELSNNTDANRYSVFIIKTEIVLIQSYAQDLFGIMTLHGETIMTDMIIPVVFLDWDGIIGYMITKNSMQKLSRITKPKCSLFCSVM